LPLDVIDFELYAALAKEDSFEVSIDAHSVACGFNHLLGSKNPTALPAGIVLLNTFLSQFLLLSLVSKLQSAFTLVTIATCPYFLAASLTLASGGYSNTAMLQGVGASELVCVFLMSIGFYK
jgi:hypothetical protein